jgi:hypothetical protein
LRERRKFIWPYACWRFFHGQIVPIRFQLIRSSPHRF